MSDQLSNRFLPPKLQILLDDLLKEAAHIVCDDSNKDAGGTLSDVLSGPRAGKVNTYGMDILKTPLHFLWYNRNGMLPASEIFFERLSRNQFD